MGIEVLDGLVCMQVWQNADVAESLDWIPAHGFNGVLWKALDGDGWMGNLRKPDGSPVDRTGFKGADGVTERAELFHARGLRFGVWTNPRSDLDLDRQIQLTVEAARRADFLALDVEPYEDFWGNNRPDGLAQYLAEGIRVGLGPHYPILLQPDPRPAGLRGIKAWEWLPSCDGLAGQWYWGAFQQPMTRVIDDCIASFDPTRRHLPTFSVEGATPSDMREAARRIRAAGASGVIYWAYHAADDATALAMAEGFGPIEEAPVPEPEATYLTPDDQAALKQALVEMEFLADRLPAGRMVRAERQSIRNQLIERIYAINKRFRLPG